MSLYSNRCESMRLLIAEPLAAEPAFLAELHRLDPAVTAAVWPQDGVPEADILVAFALPPEIERLPTDLRAVFCFGAGVEQLLGDPRLPPHLPVARLLDEGQAQRMLDYVLAAAFARLIDLPVLAEARARRAWILPDGRLDRRDLAVAVLGLGFIGERIATGLRDLGFAVRAWSRQPRTLPGIAAFAGPDGLAACAEGADLLVNVLPATPELKGVLGTRLLQRLAPGAHLVNIGRGSHLPETDLCRALVEGPLAHAWLDVFTPEPPAPDHWIWRDSRVTLTPHLAGVPSPAGAAASLASVIAALRAGDALPGLVRGGRA